MAFHTQEFTDILQFEHEKGQHAPERVAARARLHVLAQAPWRRSTPHLARYWPRESGRRGPKGGELSHLTLSSYGLQAERAPGGARAAVTRSDAPMMTTLISTVLIVMLALAYVARTGASAGSTRSNLPVHAQSAVIDPSEDITVGTRYLVPALPPGVLDALPAAVVAGDRYLTQRTALAELVVGDHILAAEDLATRDARDLPGFDKVLQADGFQQAPDGTWFYDRFSSWMRFPLNR